MHLHGLDKDEKRAAVLEKGQTVCEQALQDQKRKALLRGYVRLRRPRGEYRGVRARRRAARFAGSTNKAAAKAAACRIRLCRMRRAAQVRQSAARVSGGVSRGVRGQGMEKAAVGGVAGRTPREGAWRVSRLAPSSACAVAFSMSLVHECTAKRHKTEPVQICGNANRRSRYITENCAAPCCPLCGQHE